MSFVCIWVKQSISRIELNNWRGYASLPQSQLGKLNYASAGSVLSYSGYNNIGNMGCKYLSRASLNCINYLWIGNSKVMKAIIRLEAKECSISPRRGGARLGRSVYVNEY
jgi:hypothetical protein